MQHRPTTIFLALACLAAPAAAQWGPVTTPTSPTARSGAMMAFDVLQSRMLMFGGNASNELWSFANDTWTLLTPATSPTARHRSAMATNALSGEILLYGGIESGTSSQFSAGDTWAWNGTTWTQLSPSNAPPGLARHAMVFDISRQVTVLYGGRNNLWQPNQALSGTWEYHTGNWFQVIPTNSPPGLTDPAMAYHAQIGLTVLFGGADSSGLPRDETWTYDGFTWQQVALTGPRPSARMGARMEAILSRGVVMLTGGRDPVTQVIQNDSWEFDGNTWQQVHPVYGGMYPPRADFAMAHDFTNDRITAFGGVTATGFPLDDTMQFGAQFQPFGNGCAGTAGTPQLRLGTRPVIGTTCTVHLDNLLPTMPFGVMAVGLSRTQWPLGSLPMLLTNLGMPNCRSYTSADLLVTIPATGGTATWSFAFPPLPVQLGDAYYLQGLSVDPNVNAAWLTVSNAATLVVGY